MQRVLLWLRTVDRKRAARFVVVIGAVIVLGQFLRGAPHETHVRVDLGARHAEVQHVRFAWSREGAAMRDVELDFPDGAPAHVDQYVELAPGRWELETTAVGRGGEVANSEIEVPAEGTVVVRLLGP